MTEKTKRIILIAAGVLLGASDEEEDDAAGFSLGKIALSCLGIGRGGGLALPVEEVAVDGVVFVEGSIGEFFLRFIECHEEDVCRARDGVTVRMVEVFHAFANAGGRSRGLRRSGRACSYRRLRGRRDREALPFGE